jgi:hypothetical protein
MQTRELKSSCAGPALFERNDRARQNPTAVSENPPSYIREVLDQLDAYHLPERIRKLVSEINMHAGFHLVESLDFLPDQRSVIRVPFSNSYAEHVMEIVIRRDGPMVVFYTIRDPQDRWRRYFRGDFRSAYRTTVHKLPFNAAEISDDVIQSWLFYLMSSFHRKFKPDARNSCTIQNFRMGTFVDEIRA